MAAYNYGLGNKDMARAGHNALRDRSGLSFASVATLSARWGAFCAWAKGQGIRRMEKLTREDVARYGAGLAAKARAGEMEASTAQNYVSAVNTVMALARGDKALSVSPSGDCGIAKRAGVAVSSKAATEAEHADASESLPDRLNALLGLQRHLGLRFKESALLDARRALKTALSDGAVKIEAGTKGGRPRIVPVLRAEQVEALTKAAAVQDGRSMVPKDARYVDFQRACYREFSNWHGERHAYAQARYEALAGAPCPVVAGIRHGKAHHVFLAGRLRMSIDHAKGRDAEARQTVAEELGHGRIGITNAYLG